MTQRKVFTSFLLNQLATLTLTAVLSVLNMLTRLLSGAQYPSSELVKDAGAYSLNLKTDCSLTPTHMLPANEATPQQKLLLITDASH